MTKQEFISKVQAYKHISGKGALVAGLVVLLCAAILVGGIEAIIKVRTIRNDWLLLLALAGVSIVIFVPLSLIYHLWIRAMKLKLLRLGLVCPGCGSAFLNQTARALVATGSCARCGRKILDEKADD